MVVIASLNLYEKISLLQEQISEDGKEVSDDDLGKILSATFKDSMEDFSEDRYSSSYFSDNLFKKLYMKKVRKKITEFYPETGPIKSVNDLDSENNLVEYAVDGTIDWKISELLKSGFSYGDIFSAVYTGANEYSLYEDKRDTIHKKIYKEYDYIQKSLDSMLES